MSETHSFVKIFFSYQDASMFVERYMDDHEEGWELSDFELKLLPNGGVRAGMSVRRKEEHHMEVMNG
jgi:hypothetical protein